mmetsp:Transcript_141561/g.440067  ORF Transcript_141561/g.440067 Transcript_141561/m.440067 type:complete len:307 (+) Transcript_141561:411-1331(+)
MSIHLVRLGRVHTDDHVHLLVPGRQILRHLEMAQVGRVEGSRHDGCAAALRGRRVGELDDLRAELKLQVERRGRDPGNAEQRERRARCLHQEGAAGQQGSGAPKLPALLAQAHCDHTGQPGHQAEAPESGLQRLRLHPHVVAGLRLMACLEGGGRVDGRTGGGRLEEGLPGLAERRLGDVAVLHLDLLAVGLVLLPRPAQDGHVEVHEELAVLLVRGAALVVRRLQDPLRHLADELALGAPGRVPSGQDLLPEALEELGAVGLVLGAAAPGLVDGVVEEDGQLHGDVVLDRVPVPVEVAEELPKVG